SACTSTTVTRCTVSSTATQAAAPPPPPAAPPACSQTTSRPPAIQPPANAPAGTGSARRERVAAYAWVRRSRRQAPVRPPANLIMDLDDAGRRPRFIMIRDRDDRFPGLFDAVLAGFVIRVVLSGVRMLRMNSVMER